MFSADLEICLLQSTILSPTKSWSDMECTHKEKAGRLVPTFIEQLLRVENVVFYH